jgi:hypothetical protein
MRTLLSWLVKLITCVAFILSLPAHAQWAVVDVSAQMQWPTQIRTMIEQYNTLRAQFDKLAEQVRETTRINEQITGVTGKARLANGLVEQAERRWLPTSWQDVIAMQKEGLNPGRYLDRLKWYEERLKTIDAKLIVPGMPGHRANWNYQLSSDNTRAALAAAEGLFDQLGKRLRNVESTERADRAVRFAQAGRRPQQPHARGTELHLHRARPPSEHAVDAVRHRPERH